jgi:hypothetical protein
MTLTSPESTVAPLSPDVIVEEEARQEQEDTNAKVAGATLILTLGSIASRVLGLLREISLSFLFGPSPQVSAFLVATAVPTAINDLLISGHVNGAIIPVLSEIVTVKGREELWRVLSILTSLITVLLAVIVLFIEVFAPQIIALMSSADTPHTQILLSIEMLRSTLSNPSHCPPLQAWCGTAQLLSSPGSFCPRVNSPSASHIRR